MENYMGCLLKRVSPEAQEAKCCKCGRSCYHIEDMPASCQAICVECMGAVIKEKGAVIEPTAEARKRGAQRMVIPPQPRFGG